MIEQLGLEPIKETLNRLGGWPVTKSNWSDFQWSWQKIVQDLELVIGYPTNFVFEIGVGTDQKNTSKRILTVSSWESFLIQFSIF